MNEKIAKKLRRYANKVAGSSAPKVTYSGNTPPVYYTDTNTRTVHKVTKGVPAVLVGGCVNGAYRAIKSAYVANRRVNS